MNGCKECSEGCTEASSNRIDRYPKEYVDYLMAPSCEEPKPSDEIIKKLLRRQIDSTEWRADADSRLEYRDLDSGKGRQIMAQPYILTIHGGDKCSEAFCQLPCIQTRIKVKLDSMGPFGHIASASLASHDCRGCAQYDCEGACKYHTIPPHELIRNFCSAHPEYRPNQCKGKDPQSTNCSCDCYRWEVFDCIVESTTQPEIPRRSLSGITIEKVMLVTFLAKRGGALQGRSRNLSSGNWDTDDVKNSKEPPVFYVPGKNGPILRFTP